MSPTPDDPNQAQAWITGDPPDQTIDFYIPRGNTGLMGPVGPIGPSLSVGEVLTVQGPAAPGTIGATGLTGPKGDPGGLVGGTDLGENNLNNIVVPGIYRKNATATGRLALNYPNDTDSGVLIVLERVASTTIIQMWHSFGPVPGSGNGFFYRTMASLNSWTAWRFNATQRIDQSAGRALYTWDHINAREQLIYGDTGWRDVTSLAGTGWFSGGMYVRRISSLVELHIDNVTLSATTPNATLIALPVGFRPTWNAYLPAIHGPTRGSRSFFTGSSGSHGFNNAGNSEVMSCRLSYTTTETWPTTLPGIATGSIPNT